MTMIGSRRSSWVEADSPAVEAEEASRAAPLAAAPSRAADPAEAGDG